MLQVSEDKFEGDLQRAKELYDVIMSSEPKPYPHLHQYVGEISEGLHTYELMARPIFYYANNLSIR